MPEQSTTIGAHQAMPDVNPFDSAASPSWVKDRHPEYATSSHASGPVISNRELHAHGRVLEVRTTYEVSLDGQPVHLHLMVDSDGRLWSHVCPYQTFATAVDLVRYVLEHVPEALQGLHSAQHSGHHGHGGHP